MAWASESPGNTTWTQVARDVVEVAVAQDGVVDRDLLGNGQRAADGSRVDENGVVDQEGRGPLALPFAAVGPEDLEPHSHPRAFANDVTGRFRGF